MTDEEFADYIEKKTIKRISINAKDLPLFNAHIVYMVMGKDEILYIGMSDNGVSRLFHRDHHVVSKINNSIESITIFETKTSEEACILEARMIREFKPKYNSKKKPTRKWTTPEIIGYYQAEV